MFYSIDGTEAKLLYSNGEYMITLSIVVNSEFHATNYVRSFS